MDKQKEMFDLVSIARETLIGKAKYLGCDDHGIEYFDFIDYQPSAGSVQKACVLLELTLRLLGDKT